MNGKERIKRILAREPVDRIGLYEHFWGDTIKQWRAQACIGDNEGFADHFGFDMSGCGCFKLTARLDMPPETLEETDETIVQRDGNYAVMRRHKLHSTTPEHIDFAVKERSAWESLIKPFLTPKLERINVDAYLQVMENKAGMDPLRIKQRFGARIALCGGLDARNLQQNRIAAIDAELQAKIPTLMQGSGYILHSDHSIPTSTRYETYRHFVDEGLRLGTYT